MESRLYQAALSGDVPALDALLREDELILDRASLTCFQETSLHIAIMCGHLHFATSLLHRRPKLSGEFDSLHRLPIHLAAIEGHAELVGHLLDVSRDSCSVRDEDGKTPLHLAAMKGRVHVIKVLIRCCPTSIEEKSYRGETSLHLCVRYNQLEALKLLVEASTNEAFLDVKDNDGNTVLHLATFLKHLEIVRYLVSIPRIKAKINAVNRMGFTALALLEHSPRDFKSLEIGDILMKVVTNKVEDPNIKTILGTQSQQLLPNISGNTETKAVKSSCFTQLLQACKKYLKRQSNWVEEVQGSLMLVATLTATISFQVALSPPGGVWQQTYLQNSTEPFCGGQGFDCVAGTAVFAYVYPHEYFVLIAFATLSFLASMSIVLLAISGLPLKNKVCTWFMTVAMIVAMTFTAFIFLYSMILVTPDHMLDQASKAYGSTFYIWESLIGIVALCATVRLLLWLGRIWPKFKPSLRVMLPRPTGNNSSITI